MKAWYKIPRTGKLGLMGLVVLVGVMAFAASPGESGRLSPASLDVDTCGFPTEFGPPTCEQRTHWELDKTTESGPFTDPDAEPFSFTVTVTEGKTEKVLSGEGTLYVTNSGEVTTTLSSIAVNLEKVWTGKKKDNPAPAPGPSGDNWELLATAIQNEAEACDEAGKAVTCYGDLFATEGATLVLYDPDSNDIIALTGDLIIEPTIDNDHDGLRDEDPPLPSDPNMITGGCSVIDNDGDGFYDEDPINFDAEGNPIDDDGDGLFNEDDPDDDGDGLVDEDGWGDPASGTFEGLIINFSYEFPIDGLGIEGPGDGTVPSDDDLRIDLIATFQAGNGRGGTCTADVDCDGEDDAEVRSIQQRLRFDPVECTPVCECVTLEDLGAYALDDACVEVTSNTLEEEICATYVEGAETYFTIEGTVTCDCDPAVHGVEPDLEAFAEALPDQVQMKVQYPYGGGPAYFPTTTISGGTVLDGTYEGWCIDTDHTIGNNTWYTADVYSSYETLPSGLVDYPENMDLVNWIINQGYVGQPSPGCSGSYTYGDVQRAIWTLVDPNSTSGLGSWSQCRVDEILAAANANGEGFTPDCEDYIAVILQPVGGQQVVTIAQVTFASVEVPCGCECSTVVTNTATLTCDDNSLISGSPASASFIVTCGGELPPADGIEPGDFCSQTQGGWSQECNKPDPCEGGNTGCLRDCNFNTVFPSGVIVGDPDGPDGDELYAILLTSSAAIAEYLPAGGTPAALTADQTNPLVTSSGVFGGQLTAATINLGFNANGIGKEPIPPGSVGQLGSLVYQTCVADALIGQTVSQVVAWSNCAISGESLATCGVPATVTISDLNNALTVLNQEFVDCDTVVGCLALPAP